MDFKEKQEGCGRIFVGNIVVLLISILSVVRPGETSLSERDKLGLMNRTAPLIKNCNLQPLVVGAV